MTNITARPHPLLTEDELTVLAGHAEGIPARELADRLGLSAPHLKLLEQDIRLKLGARSPMHMISRAFQLGILRAVCLVLCFSFAAGIDTQTTRTAQARPAVSRTVRCNRQFV